MKNTFIKATVILMIGTMITKILGFFIKIIFTRIIGEGIEIYSLIMPTYSLLIAITNLGLPYAISTIMARNNVRGIHVFSSIIPIAILFNIIVIFILFLIAPVLSNDLLNNKDAYLPIISISFVLPFTTISGIIKGYYFGKQKTLPNSISSILEQIVRLLLLLLIIPPLTKKSIILAVSAYIIISGICEIVQIIVYLFFAPKNLHITLNDLKIQIPLMNEILELSLPNVGGRLIGNISYFLEPIILTNILLFVGYSNKFIISEYAIYNAYVIPLLTMPSFFTLALNTTLIPEISKNYQNKEKVKRIILKVLKISLIIGIIFNIIIFLKGDLLLSLIYNTNKGTDYLKVLSLFFPLFYLEGPLISALQGLNLSKFTMQTTLKGCILKNIAIIIFSLFSIGIYGLIISEILNIIYILITNYKKLKQLKYL